VSQQRPIPPPKSTMEELEIARATALANFVQERRGEGLDDYQARVVSRLAMVSELFARTNDLLNFTGEALLSGRDSIEAARFLCGPPVSADDLDSLSGYPIGGRRIVSPEAADAAASLLRALFDPVRLPWLTEERSPTEEERRAAIGWTSGIWAAEVHRTSRRTSSSRRQEEAVIEAISSAGFAEGGRRRAINNFDDLPRGMFSRECQLNGAKCDVPVRLLDGRMLAIECKVSNSAVNSYKRLVHETGNKARDWRNAFGEQVLPAAVLAGVFKPANLWQAQDERRIVLFWQHDLRPLTEFLQAAR
jgi:XamI restriction endonuclease